MKQYNLTLRQTADLLHVQPSTISAWRSGARKMPAIARELLRIKADKLAQAFGSGNDGH